MGSFTSNRDRYLHYTYGLRDAHVNEILKAQGYRCAICRDGIDEDFHVDHSHATGEVRGLLCAPCNKGLGHFKDNVESLRNAIRYLDPDAIYIPGRN